MKNEGQTQTICTSTQFAAWCQKNDMPIKITKESYSGFIKELRGTVAVNTIKKMRREFYYIGISSPDFEVRDYFFANNPDLRSVEDILGEPWWPNISRVLASGLEIPEKRRVVRELDNFFRWRQRTDGDHHIARLQQLFLDDDMSLRTRYQRISRLCRGLDTVLPGDEDLALLRKLQTKLAAQVWPPKTSKVSQARRVPEVEALLLDRRHWKTGELLKMDTLERHRKVLNLHFDLLAGKGRPLAFDRAALETFAAHVWTRLGLGKSDIRANGIGERTKEQGSRWKFQTASSMCQSLAPFICDPDLKRKWYRFAAYFGKKAAGEIKRKERALATSPITLEELFLHASELHHRAESETNIQVRHGILTVLGALGILLFFPLRQGDLRRIRVGLDLIRKRGKWVLMPGPTDKTGLVVDPIVLPEEGSDLLDACLLAGASRSRLHEVYALRNGTPLLLSPRHDGAYSGGAFTELFKRWTGHTPHIVRTLWCDELVALGADRSTVGAMLQHGSPITQEQYQVIAGKLRRIRAMDALREIGDRVSAD